MELEKENDLPREVSRDQEDSAISKDMEMEATPPADEKKRGKRRSENGDHDHSKKRSKKKKSKKDDDEHGAADHGAPDGGGDGEGDKRKGSERSSSNHHHGHRDHHHHHSRHHRDNKDRSDKSSSSSSSASSSVEAASRKSADREGDDQRIHNKKTRKQHHPDANHDDDDGHGGDGSRHGHRRHHDAGDHSADHADDRKRSKDDRSRHGSREKDERERGRSSSRPRDERRRTDDDNDERSSSSRHHRDRHHHRDRRDDGGDDDYHRRHRETRDRRDVERYEDRDHHRHTERYDDRESHRHQSRRADDASYERELREYRRRQQQQQQQQQQQPLDGESSRGSARQRDEAPADSRRRGPGDYADRRDPDRRDNGGRGQDQQQQQQQPQQKPKQVVDEELARMVEEELRRKESEQTEEEKAQKLIEERRRKRQAILDKYKQQQPPQQDKAAAAADEAASSSSTSTDAATAAPAAADENKKAEEAERLAAVAATDATTGTTTATATSTSTSTANASSTSEGEAKRTVTHFDMFNELPASLIPSDDKLGRPARAAAAAGEDELNLQDNWDDEEGYYTFRIGEMIKGRYAVHASHGKGVFSTVLIAKDTHKDDVEVAIKVIRNNDTMFRAGRKETELLEKITAADPKDKRHCIRVLDSFQYRNHLCIVLEPMSMNLREVVKKFGRDVGITMQAVRTYARQLFVALKHLKSLNVLHADLKPDNIVLNHNLTVLKLCDFGSASLMEEENAITPYLVSRFYRAPEIMLGLPYDFEIDVWAAGCCLFEMYTGRILFQGQSNNEMLRMQMEAMGPFGRKMLRRSKFWQRHFNQQTFYFQQVCIDEVSKQEYVKEVNVVKPTRDLRAELQRAASAEDESQAGQLADLVLKCLQLDPSKRISPELALAHPFLKAP